MERTQTTRRGAARGIAAILAVLSVLFAPCVQPQEAAPPPEVFFGPAQFTDAKLSPSGRRVAFTTSVGGERVGLFVWELADPPRLTRAVRFSDVDVREFAWMGEDRLVFDVNDLASGSGEQLAPGLWSVRYDGEELRQLVMRQGRPFLSAPSSGRPPLEWYHRLLHVPSSGDEVIVGEMQWQGNDLVSVTPIWLNVVTGRSGRVAIDAPPGTVAWLFDAGGEARVAVARREGRRLVHWRGPGAGSWRLLDDSPLMRVPFEPRFVDDRGGLYVLRPSGAGGTSELVRWDVAAGRPEPKSFVATPGFDFSGALITDGDGGRLLGVRVDTDAEGSVWFDPAMKRVQQAVDQRLPGYATRLACRRCGQPDSVVLVRAWSARDPGHLWLYEPADNRWRLIGPLRKEVEARRMAQVDFQRIKARDGRDLPLWLTIPPGRKAGDRGPAVVLVHGGPWVRGGHWVWSPMEQFLASRGYLVLSPEFRGSRGYGVAHERAGFRQWGRAMQDDVADAARWAIAQGWADRACIAGASYGGYATLMGLVNDPDLYRCGIAWVAVADLPLMLSGSWWVDDDTGDASRRYLLPEIVGDPVKDAEMLRAVSPVEQAARIRAPLLLAYGERDRRVPLAHGERLRKALRAEGRDPEWVVYDGEAHGWLKLETRVDFARRVEAFLARHLGPADQSRR